jgi:hypothetical protein
MLLYNPEEQRKVSLIWFLFLLINKEINLQKSELDLFVFLKLEINLPQGMDKKELVV